MSTPIPGLTFVDGAILGSGTHGIVVLAFSTHIKFPNTVVAVKLMQQAVVSRTAFKREVGVMKQLLSKRRLVPKLIAHGENCDQWIMVMTLCGPSLGNVLHVPLQPVDHLFDLMIDCVEYVHSRGYLHCDIKPDNFCFSTNHKHLVLIDFGNARPYNPRETPPQLTSTGLFLGNIHFASINAHQCMPLSRRDDLESVAYVFLDLVGSLPWTTGEFNTLEMRAASAMGSEDKAPIWRLHQEVQMSKESLLLQPSALHPGVLAVVQYCRKLQFHEDPDYNYIRGLIRSGNVDL